MASMYGDYVISGVEANNEKHLSVIIRYKVMGNIFHIPGIANSFFKSSIFHFYNDLLDSRNFLNGFH